MPGQLGQSNQPPTYIQIDQAMCGLEAQIRILQDFIKQLSEGPTPPSEAKISGGADDSNFTAIYSSLPDRLGCSAKEIDGAIAALKNVLM